MFYLSDRPMFKFSTVRRLELEISIFHNLLPGAALEYSNQT